MCSGDERTLKITRRIRFGDNWIAKRSNLLDLDYHFFASTQPARWSVAKTDSGWCARADDIAGFECHKL